jgi:hypothetical protein
MPQGFFDCTPEELKALDSNQAVELLHRILLAEARRLGINIAELNIPYNVNAPDGGIDGQINGYDDQLDLSPIVLSGHTAYQVKSGDFDFTDSSYRNMLFDGRKRGSPGTLKPQVREIAEQNATFVLFLTSKSDPNRSDKETAIFDIIAAEVPGTTMTVKLVEIDSILGILAPHLPVRLWVKGYSEFPGETFDAWERKQLMSLPFQSDPDRDQIIENIQQLVRSSDRRDRNIRVSGFPGNGKTRSVLEALRADDLTSSVIYFDSPSKALDRSLLNNIGLVQDITAIIVIDECDANSFTQANDILGNAADSLKLITIYNEPGNTVNARNVDIDENHLLSEESIKQIMVRHGLTQDLADRWAMWCDRSPRIAHMLAENLANASQDLLQNPSYSSALELFISNRGDIDSDEYKKRKKVLMWLSLFKRFGWHNDYENERQFIIRKIINDYEISLPDIRQVISDLKERKVLQGDKTIYISPRVLHIRAWIWWWNDHSDPFDYPAFQSVEATDGSQIQMTNELKSWFTDMFRYAQDSRDASNVVQEMLSDTGILANQTELLEALGNNFFFNLTVAAPEAALHRLKVYLQDLSEDGIKNLSYRSEILRCLEVCVVEGPLFYDAASLIQKLALTETDHRYSNNSVGIFSALFSNAPGQVAPTQAPPNKRLPLLEDTFEHHGDAGIDLALQCINVGLEADSFFRVVGPEQRGLRPDVQMWRPETYQELWDAYKNIWDYLVAHMSELNDKQREKAITTINNQLRGLLRIRSLATDFIKDYDNLTIKGLINKEQAVQTITLIKKYESDNLSAETIELIDHIIDRLEGSTTAERLERLVGMDLMDDWYGDELESSNQKLQSLVKEFLDTPQLLSEYPWLYTDKAKGGYRFAKLLGDNDEENVVWPVLLDGIVIALSAEDNPSVFFFSGYLMSIYERDQAAWTAIIKQLNSIEVFKPYIVEIIWRNGLNDEVGAIVLDNIKAAHGKSEQLNMFRLGGSIKNLSEPVFKQWIEFLLQEESGSSKATALDLFMTYYVFNVKRKLPKTLALRVLTNELLAKKTSRGNSSIEWEWTQVANRFLDQYPQSYKDLFEFMIERVGIDDTLFDSSYREPISILTRLCQIDPVYTWPHIGEKLLAEKSWKQYHYFENWLSGPHDFGHDSVGAMAIFPKNLIINWIGEDTEKRAALVAGLVPHQFDAADGKDSWLTILLKLYGENEALHSALIANFWSEGYSGPSSRHYAIKLEEVRRYKSQHADIPNVANWADKYIAGLSQSVERAKADEERSDFY